MEIKKGQKEYYSLSIIFLHGLQKFFSVFQHLHIRVEKYWIVVDNEVIRNRQLFKVSSSNTRKRCEMCSKLTIKLLEDVIDVVIANVEHIYIFY